MLLITLGFFTSIQVSVADVNRRTNLATLFAFDSKRETKLMNWVQTIEMVPNSSDMRMAVRNEFKSESGELQAVENLVVGAVNFKQYSVEHPSIGTKGTVEVKEGRVHFRYENGGQVKEDSEEATDNLVVGPSLVPFISAKWDVIQSGKELDVRFAVPDRLETVGFSIKKVESMKIGDVAAVKLKMRPTSFIIAAIVEPLHFVLSEDGKRLFSFSGRVVPKLKERNRWKDLDAETVFAEAGLEILR